MAAKKREPGWFSSILKIVIVLFCIGLGVFGLREVLDGNVVASTPAAEADNRLTAIPTKGQYDVGLDQFEYRKAMLEEYKKDTLFMIEGEIIQLMHDTFARIATKEQPYLGFIEDVVWTEFLVKPKVLEGDLVKIYGRYQGVYTYQTVLQQMITIPKIAVDYCEIIQEKE
jgi:hypothetical protein